MLSAQPQGCARKILSKMLAFEMNFLMDKSNKQPFYAIHHFC